MEPYWFFRSNVKVTIDKRGNNLVNTVEIKLFSVIWSNSAGMLPVIPVNFRVKYATAYSMQIQKAVRKVGKKHSYHVLYAGKKWENDSFKNETLPLIKQ